MPTRVSAGIVVYVTPAELAAAVGSLHAQERVPDEIIIVDNGASEGAPIAASAQLDGVRIERTPRNIGFGAGCNRAAKLATGDLLLMMNADVVLTAKAIRKLVAHLDDDPSVAVVGPRILSGGRVQSSARQWPSLRTGLLGRRSVATRLLLRAGRYPTELKPTHHGGGEVDWVSGACMLIRTSAYWEVGGFDEAYWMYWEDADLCRRLANKGWKVSLTRSSITPRAQAGPPSAQSGRFTSRPPCSPRATSRGTRSSDD